MPLLWNDRRRKGGARKRSSKNGSRPFTSASASASSSWKKRRRGRKDDSCSRCSIRFSLSISLVGIVCWILIYHPFQDDNQHQEGAVDFGEHLGQGQSKHTKKPPIRSSVGVVRHKTPLGLRHRPIAGSLIRYKSVIPPFHEPTLPVPEGSSCRYHGNCPFGQLCHEKRCQNYMPSSDSHHQQQQPTADHRCVQACREELIMDERFYHGTMPKLQRVYPLFFPIHNSNKDVFPMGCILDFERHPRKPSRATSEQEGRDDLSKWMQSRMRLILRTDPVFSSDPHHHLGQTPQSSSLWRTVCSAPCDSVDDCSSERYPSIQCSDRTVVPGSTANLLETVSTNTCQLQQPSDMNIRDMVLVSGSESGYFDGLKNLAASLYYWSPSYQMVVYNLGLTDDQLSNVAAWPNVKAIRWQNGIPQSYPPHVRENLHNYAWKSIIVNETVHEFKSIFWLDAGATLTGPIEEIEEIIHKNGIFLMKGQDDNMKAKSHEATYAYLGYDKQTFEGGPHYAGGIQGHVYPSRFVAPIVQRNAQCALDPDCIAPRGSSLSTHRYDQTSLSILSYQRALHPSHYTEMLAASSAQLSSDLGKSSGRFKMWTARGGCYFYSELLGWK